MDKVITIYSGDEHRAKMEKQFSRTDIFADVYNKAYRLVTQIEDEMKRYNEVDKNRLARYQGMGNNIVLFCGGRGQGKTSVMQSFAKCLDGSYKSERKIAESEVLTFVKDVRNEKYEVVDSIDPSAMENGESILRVLISRLFFKMEEYVNSEACSAKDNKEFLQNKKKIVELFEDCYTNIECIKNGKKADCGQDDLQNLSQMGSSAKLKQNLYELIRIYLTMMADSGKFNEENARYLVIPIDDADLATKRLFRLCEDIRNYLSIPNVIILMAVDYEQLVHATYQRYLKQYKVMRKADVLSGQNTDIGKECHIMAAKYLEKVFPIIHRIDLPQIDNLLREDYEEIKFDYRYMTNEGKLEPVFTDVSIDKCKNLQDQLAKILYSRTGLVFSIRGQGLHPFMPHTLRELTHWVKMLHDMHVMNCDADVYQKYQRSESMTEELEQNILWLRDNILTIKQYFLSYWCEKYLDIPEARAFQRIDNVAIRQHSEAGNDDVGDWDEAPAAARMIYREVTHNITIDEEDYLRSAVCIYDTIFMNEWFALALKDSTQFRKIARFVEKTVNLSGCFGDADQYMGKYSTMQFDINVEALKAEFDDEINPAVDMCLNSFCAAKQNDKIDESIEISCETERSIQINPRLEALEFDMLRPVIAQLTAAGEIETAGDERIKAPYLATVRNVIANYDIQMHLRDVITLWYEEKNGDSGFVPLNIQTANLYEVIGAEIEVLQNESEDNIAGIYAKAIAENEEALNIFFLCNYENCKNYIIQMAEDLETCCGYVRMRAEGLEQKIIANDVGRIADTQKLIKELLGRLERESDKLWSEWYSLNSITDSFGLEMEWSRVNDADNEVDNLTLQLSGLEEKAEAQLSAIAAERSDDSQLDQNSDNQDQPEVEE